MSKTFLIMNNDVVYTSGRQPQTISDGPKVRQDIGEMLSVNIQPDGFGAGIFQTIGSSYEDPGSNYQNIEYTLRDKITSGTSRFMALQQKSVTNKPSTELLSSIVNLQVAQSTDDPTTFFWRVDYQTQNGQSQTIAGRVSS